MTERGIMSNMSDFKAKAMPGQDGWEPNTEYSERVAGLAGAAARATEVFTEDELEAHAERARASVLPLAALQPCPMNPRDERELARRMASNLASAFGQDYLIIGPGGRERVKAPAPSVDFHHVCETEPSCRCAGEGSEECCCMPEDREVLHTVCDVCGAAMHAIDMESGERLPEGARSSFGVSTPSITVQRAVPVQVKVDAAVTVEPGAGGVQSIVLRVGDTEYPVDEISWVDDVDVGAEDASAVVLMQGGAVLGAFTVARDAAERFGQALQKLGLLVGNAVQKLSDGFRRFADDVARAYPGGQWAEACAIVEPELRRRLCEWLLNVPELRRRARTLLAGRYRTETARRRAMRRLLRAGRQACPGVLAVSLSAAMLPDDGDAAELARTVTPRDPNAASCRA